jgi:3-methyladenine DNA glycosylase/8-oxoguanine DNA glycosylase
VYPSPLELQGLGLWRVHQKWPRASLIALLPNSSFATIVPPLNQQALDYLRTDPVMAGLIDQVGPLDLRPRRLTPFQSLTRAIIYQQLSGKAAALFGDHSFPTPEAVLESSLERLREAGLSRPKARYILGMAQQALDGLIPTLDHCDRLTDAEILERLTAIKGVGRWTVEMLLIFNLGRPDVLPVHDLGVRKGFQFAYRKRRLPEPDQLERFGRRWAPYRTTAAWYLWRAVDLRNAQR